MADDADHATEGTLGDDDELIPARKIFHSLFEHLTLSDAIEMSGAGTEELDISRARPPLGPSAQKKQPTLGP